MTKLQPKSKSEKEVFNYIIKHTSKGWKGFNPLLLSREKIAKRLDLLPEEVQEALDTLSAESGGVEIIENVTAGFDIWLPCDENGENIKDELQKSNLAYSGRIHLFWSFISLVVLYGIFSYVVFIGGIIPQTEFDYFGWGVILAALSVPIGRFITHKFSILTIRMRSVVNYEYYIYAIMIITLSVVGIAYYGGTGGIYLLASIVAIIVDIFTLLLFVYRAQQKSKRKQ